MRPAPSRCCDRSVLKTFEADHAMREHEVAVKMSGKGCHKRWLPQAMLRVACYPYLLVQSPESAA